MATEIEKAGIPVAFISAIPAIPLSFGVSRVVQGVAITHLLGNPAASGEREFGIRRTIVEEALASLTHAVSKPTLFDRGSLR